MKKILLVDDSDEFRSLYRTILEDEGYVISQASSGHDGLELVRKENFDLVISDIEMWNGSGLWLMQEIKKIPAPPPIIITSGNLAIAEETILEMGARAFFRKPFSLTQFLDCIRDELDASCRVNK